MNARALFLVLATAASGCWFDSRMIQEPAVQHHNAEALRPKALSATGDTKNARTYLVRVHATPQYVSQTIDWKREVTGLVEDANAILAKTVGAKLKVVDASTWTPKVPTDDLPVAMEALAAEDPGQDADWVIGLVGGLPKLTTSFHQLGLGMIPGLHVVLRAPTDLAEADAIEKGLGVSAEERASVLAERRRHRSVAVLLHELGHTLGAVHENEKTTIMAPAYAKDMIGFSEGAAAIMKSTLAHAGWQRDASIRATWAKELLGVYEGPKASSWVKEERDDIVKALHQFEGGPEPAPAPPPPAAGPPEVPSAVASAMSSADRALYAEALKMEWSGDMVTAWKTASPLFEKYPDLLHLQDFRCRVATKLATDISQIRKECERLMKLSTGK